MKKKIWLLVCRIFGTYVAVLLLSLGIAWLLEASYDASKLTVFLIGGATILISIGLVVWRYAEASYRSEEEIWDQQLNWNHYIIDSAFLVFASFKMGGAAKKMVLETGDLLKLLNMNVTSSFTILMLGGLALVYSYSKVWAKLGFKFELEDFNGIRKNQIRAQAGLTLSGIGLLVAAPLGVGYLAGL